ncbi:MAG: helix-turn-helix transcriptional regulator [Rhizobiaceae bacterium]
MKAERIESALFPRSWSFNRESDEPARQAVLVTDGTGEAEVGRQRFAIEGPALAWLGDPRSGRLRTEAGTTGFRASFDDLVLAAAIGDEAESAGLRDIVDRSFVLSLAGHAEHAQVLERCFNAMVGELRTPQAGTPLVLSALLRIALVGALRVSGGGIADTPGAGDAGSVLQGFRQLVEINFRNHWRIARYAVTLGVSTDRLHAICTAGTGKSPKALVSQRLAQEAAFRLERSTVTIQRLGHALGFADPAHFSSFFRRTIGVAPGAYRKQRALAAARGEAPPTVSFAEWP